MGAIEKRQVQEVVPAEEVRELIAAAVRDGIAEGVGQALLPVVESLNELAANMRQSNAAVAARLSDMASAITGTETESHWSEHDRRSHELDPTLAQRQAEQRAVDMTQWDPHKPSKDSFLD